MDLVSVKKRRGGFHLKCLCGNDIVTEVRSTRCLTCGRVIEIQWPDPDFESKPQEKTITENYEADK